MCVSVCLSVCNAVTLESLAIDISFLYAGTASEYLGQVCISRSPGQGQVHRSKKSLSVCMSCL